MELVTSGSREGKPFRVRHLFLTSLRTAPEAMLRLIRERWSIESWHWIRDTQLHEAKHRYRGNGAGVLAAMRTAALNLLRLAGFDSIREGLHAVMHATWLAYIEVLSDQQQTTAIGFLSRALAWFNSQGIECCQVMSDNESAHISKAFAKACSVLKLKHICTRPYTPRTNGKAESFIQTLCNEWAYAMPFQNSQERNAWLPRYLSIYNRIRRHSDIRGRSPQQRLPELFC